jgi:GNAT superfamily N-acetyltransferase
MSRNWVGSAIGNEQLISSVTPMSTSAVRPMHVDDAATAAAISLEAGRRFAAIPDPRIAACADDPPFTVDELAHYIDASRAWVATDDEAVVGLLLVDLVGGAAHIEEVDVALAAGRRGHGSRLVAHAAGWARTSGVPALTLTTFRDVPWNAPWYLRQGFRILSDAELTPQLVALRAREDAQGLPAELRVVMRRELERTSAR